MGQQFDHQVGDKDCDETVYRPGAEVEQAECQPGDDEINVIL